jgi:hypothetical protein
MLRELTEKALDLLSLIGMLNHKRKEKDDLEDGMDIPFLSVVHVEGGTEISTQWLKAHNATPELRQRKPTHSQDEPNDHVAAAGDSNYILASSVIDYYERMTLKPKVTIHSAQDLYINMIFIPTQDKNGTYYVPSNHPFTEILLDKDAFTFGDTKIAKTKVLQISPTPFYTVDRLLVEAVVQYMYNLLVTHQLVPTVQLEEASKTQ